MRARRFAAGIAAIVLLLGLSAGCSDDDGGSSADSTAPNTSEGPPSSPKPLEKLEILVTNDDGVTSEGLDVLVKGLRSIEDVNVTVVAPADQRSGTGGSTTPGELEVTDVELAQGFPAKAVKGFPADTVRVAIDEMGLKPDLVVAGINEGQNLGPLVDVSGTVGAAWAAVARGIPSLAVSAGLVDDIDYETSMPFVLEWVDSRRIVLLEGTQPVDVTNMNVPSCTTGEVRTEPLEVPLAPATEGAVAPQDCTSTLEDPPNDVVAFNNGFVTITEPIPAKPGGG